MRLAFFLFLGSTFGCGGDPADPAPPGGVGTDEELTDTDTADPGGSDTATEAPWTGPDPWIGSGWYDLHSYYYWSVSAPPSAYFPASRIFLAAQFGFDAGSGTVEPVDLVGYPMAPTIEIYLATSQWSGDVRDTVNYCHISLPLDGLRGPAPFVGQVGGLWWGVDYDPTNPPTTNCNTFGYLLDPDVWGTDLLGGFVTAYPGAWGIAVGDPSPVIATELIPAYGSDGIYILGGQMQVPPFLGDVVPDMFGIAYQVDADMGLLVDPNGLLVPIEASQVYTGP